MTSFLSPTPIHFIVRALSREAAFKHVEAVRAILKVQRVGYIDGSDTFFIQMNPG